MRVRPWVIALVTVGGCGRPADSSPRRIVLERSMCLLACPSYRLTVLPDGGVHYDGGGYPFVAVGDSGQLRVRHDSTTIGRRNADAVFAAFDRAWSRWRPNRVRSGQRRCGDAVHDFPTISIVREWAARRDTMEVYLGCPRAPQRIIRLGTYIDSVAGAIQWLLADPVVFRALCSQADSGMTAAAG